MSSFEIEVGTLPGNISEFHGPAHLRAGDPALVIRHTSGPWSTSFYDKSLESDPRVTAIEVYEVDGVAIAAGLTTSKGSTVQADGKVVEWERPSVAYCSDDKLESLGEGDGVTDFVNSAFYIFPKHKEG